MSVVSSRRICRSAPLSTASRFRQVHRILALACNGPRLQVKLPLEEEKHAFLGDLVRMKSIEDCSDAIQVLVSQPSDKTEIVYQDNRTDPPTGFHLHRVIRMPELGRELIKFTTRLRLIPFQGGPSRALRSIRGRLRKSLPFSSSRSNAQSERRHKKGASQATEVDTAFIGHQQLAVEHARAARQLLKHVGYDLVPVAEFVTPSGKARARVPSSWLPPHRRGARESPQCL